MLKIVMLPLQVAMAILKEIDRATAPKPKITPSRTCSIRWPEDRDQRKVG